jgi:tetratricopeptide (TPR) repeat protein
MHAVSHYRAAGWSPSMGLNELGSALYFGPEPVLDAIAQCERLLPEVEGDHASEANVLLWLGGLEAMRGSMESARNRVGRARELYLQLGLTTAAGDDCARVLGLIEMLAGAPAVAEEHLRTSCELLKERQQTQVLATRAGELAQILYVLQRYDEAEAWTRLARESAGQDDLDAALAWQPVEAMLLAANGAADEAATKIRALLRATPVDAVNHSAAATLALAEVHRLAGRDQDATRAVRSAVSLYERKGNVAAATNARSLVLEDARSK